MADRLAHPTNLPVATLVDRQTKRAWFGLRNPRWCRDAIFEFNAVTQRADTSGRDISTVDLGEVFLLDAV